MLLLTNLLLATAIGPIADTTLTVRKGQRLEVSSHAGSITIRTWNRDVVKVEGETGRRGEIEVDAGATTISVEASNRHGGPGDADIVITMPVWMAVEADGVETDITIEGCRCAITAENLPGSIQEQLLALQEITLAAGKGGHVRLRHGVTIRHILHWASQKSIRYAVIYGPDSGFKV